MFTTIKARFAARCKRCGGEIGVGEKMRYGGRGRTYHLKADCAGSSSPVAADDDAIALAYENRHVGPISDELEQATRESWGDR